MTATVRCLLVLATLSLLDGRPLSFATAGEAVASSPFLAATADAPQSMVDVGASEATPPRPIAADGSERARDNADDPAGHATRAEGSTIDLATYPAERWIVQLDDPPLADYAGGLPGLPATAPAATGAERLDTHAGPSMAYRARLVERQTAFESTLRQAVPAARVERSYQIVLDGLAVRMSPQDAERVRAWPDVRAVTPDIPYQLQMFSTPAQIGAPALWERLGGQDQAGEGMKVAIVDGGIYVTYDDEGNYAGNACFDGDGYSAPPGYPKGDARFTNGKVIVARAYFRPDDAPTEGNDTPIPGPDSTAHGTHVAGTVACNAGTSTTYLGKDVELSGVAPRAYLLNYRVFYPSVTSDGFQNGNAFVAELVQAIEDAVADGADVISNSWGSSYQNTLAWPDPMVQAAEAAVEAGVVTVFAAGNSGSGPSTVISPGISPRVITVASVTKDRAIDNLGGVDVTAPEPVPEDLMGLPMGTADFGPTPVDVGPVPFIPAENVASDGGSLGCSLEGDASPFADGSLSGRVVLIERGTCNFSEKAYNAQRGGAVAALIYNHEQGGDGVVNMPGGAHAGDVTIPSRFLGRSDGLKLRDLALASPDTAMLRVHDELTVVPQAGDVMAGSSSRGPAMGRGLKPDVAAPGVSVLSSGFGSGPFPGPYTGFGAVSGTSMATPHVAGAAALLMQLHPAWTPEEVKSALVSTATEDVFLDADKTVRAGVLDRGGGRIDLSVAGDAGLTFDPPVIGIGELAIPRPGADGTAELRHGVDIVARDMSGNGGEWQVSLRRTGGITDTGHVRLSVPDALTVGSDATASLHLDVVADGDAAPGNYEATIDLVQAEGGPPLHLPVWLRLVPTPAESGVLLLDDDGSAEGSPLADYQDVYESAVRDAGLFYQVIDLGNGGSVPDLYGLEPYRAVVTWTGDRNSRGGLRGTNASNLQQWLDSGGRLWALGQDLAETQGSTNGLSGATLYHGYLGVNRATGSAFGEEAVPDHEVLGVGPLEGLSMSLNTGGAAGAQTSVEATWPMTDTDAYAGTHTTVPLLTAPDAQLPSGAALAHGRMSEPSLELPLREYDYRAVSTGFGLEGLSSADREALARQMLDWLLGRMSLSVTAERAGAAGATILHAAADSEGGPDASTITAYRWDIGDGTPIVETTDSMLEHSFAPGRWIVRVEATDAMGHREVAGTTVEVAGPVYLPWTSSGAATGLLFGVGTR